MVPVGRAAGRLRALLDEQRARKERVPRLLRHDAHAEAVRRISAGEALEDKELVLLVQVFGGDLLAERELIGRDGLVDLAPPDLVVDGGRVLEVLVLRAASREGAGLAHQGAVGGQRALAASDRFLDQFRGGQIHRGPAGGQIQLLHRSDRHFGASPGPPQASARSRCMQCRKGTLDPSLRIGQSVRASIDPQALSSVSFFPARTGQRPASGQTVAVAQLAEHKVVILGVAGSNPVGHPSSSHPDQSKITQPSVREHRPRCPRDP